jgi:hypothetical protein
LPVIVAPVTAPIETEASSRKSKESSRSSRINNENKRQNTATLHDKKRISVIKMMKMAKNSKREAKKEAKKEKEVKKETKKEAKKQRELKSKLKSGGMKPKRKSTVDQIVVEPSPNFVTGVAVKALVTKPAKITSLPRTSFPNIVVSDYTLYHSTGTAAVENTGNRYPNALQRSSSNREVAIEKRGNSMETNARNPKAFQRSKSFAPSKETPSFISNCEKIPGEIAIRADNVIGPDSPTSVARYLGDSLTEEEKTDLGGDRWKHFFGV